MRAPRTLRTALVAAGVTAALGASTAGAFAAHAPATRTAPSVTHHSKTKRVLVKTVKLADKVSRAKVYRTGAHHYEAEIWADGARYGALYANGGPAYAQHNGLRITLHPDGRVTSWMEEAKPKPVVERVLVATWTLPDGKTTAKVYRLTSDRYEADIHADGTRLGTLVAAGRRAYGEHNGLHIALGPDGQLTSWVDGRPAPAS
ncbi:hypothetical protein ACHBTE_35385 [Streptomyces sp. M41]|uniref:hypothetical protein n=1 Tax=Streptomyces sp. M41 TaxID=3059412 RepID=UPI00374D14DA